MAFQAWHYNGRGLSRWLSGKESACKAGDVGSISGSRRFPWRRKWQPTLVFLLGKSQDQRSLVGYSPGGHNESDMTEQLVCIHCNGKSIDLQRMLGSWGHKESDMTEWLNWTRFLGKTAWKGKPMFAAYFLCARDVRSISHVLSHSLLTQILWGMSYCFWARKLRIKGLVQSQTMIKGQIVHTFSIALSWMMVVYFPNLFQASL